MNGKFLFYFLAVLALTTKLSWAEDKDSLQCIGIAEDRARLICFDRLFQTPAHPVHIEPVAGGVTKTVYPTEWTKAWEKDKKRLPEDIGFVLNVSPGSFLDSITLTLPLEDTGLLVLSCIDKISRVELMLNSPVNDGIVPVTIEGRIAKKDNWLSDDTGYILRIGRGIPSIDVIKNMLDQNNIYLQFNSQSIAVPTGDLSEKVKSLRNVCRW